MQRNVNFDTVFELATITLPMHFIVTVAESDRNITTPSALQYNQEYWPILVRLLQETIIAFSRDTETFGDPSKFTIMIQDYAKRKGYSDVSLLCDAVYGRLDEVIENLRQHNIIVKRQLCTCDTCKESNDPSYSYVVDKEASAELLKL